MAAVALAVPSLLAWLGLALHRLSSRNCEQPLVCMASLQSKMQWCVVALCLSCLVLAEAGTQFQELRLQLRSEVDGALWEASGDDSPARLNLAVLEGDRKRVSGIMSRLDEMLRNPSELVQEELRKRRRHKRRRNGSVAGRSVVSTLQCPVVSGLSQGSGEYFASVGMGSPQLNTTLVMDTGSDIVWLQCAPCKNCYNQVGQIYQPQLSDSYRKVSCASHLCKQVEDRSCSARQGCLYQVSYGDGSFTVGDLSTETVRLQEKGVPNVAFGCGHDNQGLFVAAAGLMGLGRGPLSLVSQIGAAVGHVFSYCLVDRESPASSSLIFGPTSIPPATQFTRLLTNPKVRTFYYVGLQGISIGGSQVTLPASAFRIDATGAGGVIIDSGTSVTRLPTLVYQAARDEFVKLASQELGQPTLSFSLFDTCYDLSQRQSVQVPVFDLIFDAGLLLPLPARNYMVQVDSRGTVCLALAPTSASLSILGNIQQMGIRIVHDLAANRIGFATSQC